MKKAVLAVLTGASALVVLVAVQGCSVLGGPPTEVLVSAGPNDSDSTLVVSWTTPAEGAPDKYVLWFRQVTDSTYAVVGETTGTSYVHNPHGMTGQYMVTAVFGKDTYDGAEKPSTVPVYSAITTLSEINADSIHCGYGWSRDSGVGRVFAMTESANCASVDFYISDRQIGFGESLLKVVSPNVDTSDPGAAIVPKARWRANGFADPALDPQKPCTAYRAPPNADYYNFTVVTTKPCYIPCFTAGDTMQHYALIQVDSFNVTSGKLWLQSWFQLVPGLRLIRH